MWDIYIYIYVSISYCRPSKCGKGPALLKIKYVIFIGGTKRKIERIKSGVRGEVFNRKHV